MQVAMLPHESNAGAFVIFGPIVQFGKLEVPAWFELHRPDSETFRFDIDRATAVDVSLQCFSWNWLMMSTNSSTLPPTACR